LLLKQFLVCPYKLETFTLSSLGKVFAEEGVDLTTKQDTFFFNRKHCTVSKTF